MARERLQAMENLPAITTAVTEELRNAASGKETSFPFLRNKLPEHSLVQPGELFQVIVIGGSVGKSALLRKEDTALTVLETAEQHLPQFSDTGLFYNFLREVVMPDVPHIALNFAYPLDPIFRDGRLDGVLVTGMKEHAFKGLVGKPVGEEIETHLPGHTVTTANDTICLLLAGLDDNEGEVDPEGIACGIVGTGVNFAYFESPTEAINLEAANFTGFPRTEEDRLVDEASLRPGSAWLEKATSGAYLHQHFNLLVRKMGLSYPQLTSTEELDQALQADDDQVALLAHSLIERSAELIATQIAGITNYKSRDMTFLMEGSLFWKGTNYRQTVEAQAGKLASKHHISFIHHPDSPILGAAQLVARS